jgi:hypothetical protein
MSESIFSRVHTDDVIILKRAFQEAMSNSKQKIKTHPYRYKLEMNNSDVSNTNNTTSNSITHNSINNNNNYAIIESVVYSLQNPFNNQFEHIILQNRLCSPPTIFLQNTNRLSNNYLNINQQILLNGNSPSTIVQNCISMPMTPSPEENIFVNENSTSLTTAQLTMNEKTALQSNNISASSSLPAAESTVSKINELNDLHNSKNSKNFKITNNKQNEKQQQQQQQINSANSSQQINFVHINSNPISNYNYFQSTHSDKDSINVLNNSINCISTSTNCINNNNNSNNNNSNNSNNNNSNNDNSNFSNQNKLPISFASSSAINAPSINAYINSNLSQASMVYNPNQSKLNENVSSTSAQDVYLRDNKSNFYMLNENNDYALAQTKLQTIQTQNHMSSTSNNSNQMNKYNVYANVPNIQQQTLQQSQPLHIQSHVSMQPQDQSNIYNRMIDHQNQLYSNNSLTSKNLIEGIYDSYFDNNSSNKLHNKNS